MLPTICFCSIGLFLDGLPADVSDELVEFDDESSVDESSADNDVIVVYHSAEFSTENQHEVIDLSDGYSDVDEDQCEVIDVSSASSDADEDQHEVITIDGDSSDSDITVLRSSPVREFHDDVTFVGQFFPLNRSASF